MRLPRAKHLVLFACIHAVLMMGLLAYGFDLSAVDGVEPPRRTQIAWAAAGVLMFPVRLLFMEWDPPNALQWLLLIANSTLWGYLIATVVQRNPSRRPS
jgi:hypothetical protein